MPFRLERLGVVMVGTPKDPDEAMGVLNPASCRDRAGNLLLFPRMVAAGNYSRIGRALVQFTDGVPIGVKRQGYALEPTEGFECNADTAGVEDPRVTYVAALNRYVMAYTAFGPLGPRIALAVSDDAYNWRRLGPVKFAYAPEYGIDFDLYPNKDAMLFPEPVRDPHGRPALAMLHRPDFNVNWWRTPAYAVQPRGITEERPSIWISYVPLDTALQDERALLHWSDQHLLAVPEQPWEATKIGGGTPPVLTPHGWLTLYHGVGLTPRPNTPGQTVPIYQAGVLVLDRDDPRIIRYRSPEPILSPETDHERAGIVNNVVFPTAIDYSPVAGALKGESSRSYWPQRMIRALSNQVRTWGAAAGNEKTAPNKDAGEADWGDVYYGMADARIGVARLYIPTTLPATLPARVAVGS
jgi:beta-1,2-mannobiose phosphorylase / 1,2-beta-oligomannan phosphorylase